MEVGLQANQALALVYGLPLWRLRTMAVSMQGRAMVSARIPCFEREYCGSHMGPAFTQSHFSLNEEARNTERHYSANPDLKLRHSRITFISAGTSTAERLKPVMLKSKSSGELTESQFQVMSEAPVKVSDSRPPAHAVIPDAEMSSMTLDNLRSAPIPQVDLVQGLDSMFKRSNTDRGLAGPEVRNEVPSSKFRDTDEPMNTDSVTPSTRRSPSPTHSDSSREVIIFAGRHQSCNKGIQKQTSDIPSQNLTTQKISRFSGQPRPMTAVRDDPIDVKAHRIQILPKRRPSSQKALDYFDCHSRPTATLRSNRERRRRHIGIEMKDEGILDDYVANLRDGSDLEAFIESSVLAQRDLGGSDTIEWQDEVEYPPTMRVESGPMRESEQWDSADMEDFDELSTSDEVLESIEQILSKRERPSGVQYLVIGAGGTVDDARWLPVSSLNDQRARQLIREFENTESDHLLDGSHLTDASLAINEQIAQDLQEDLDDKEDENDLEERRMARMTDERVARLLSKQEELGLGSEDLILLDGRELVTDSQEELRPDGLWVRPVTHLKPSKTKTTKQSRFKTPSTTTFADTLDQDPYNGFDVMDQHRPSLRKRPKGRRGKHSLELSDSELEQSLYAAWEKDRSKKKVRKQEREELRAQGLLGKKNKTDLKVKYSQGISMAEVKKEIRDFLLSSMER